MKRKKKITKQEKQYTAIYLRVSTDEQADSGLGIDAQRTRCDAMIIVNGYIEEVRYYCDDGISGTIAPEERREGKKLFKDIEEGKIVRVIVTSLDRLARKMKYIIDSTEYFETKEVAFVSCKEMFDTSTPQGKFVLHIFAALAEMERGVIVQRTIDALNEKGKIDGEKGGRLPYGYYRTFTIDEKTNEAKATGVEIDHNKAEIVKMIYRLHNEPHVLKFIADCCEELTTGPRGGSWYASTIREILKNEEAYKGGKRGASDKNWPIILQTENEIGQ